MTLAVSASRRAWLVRAAAAVARMGSGWAAVATIERLHREFVDALHLADVQEMFAATGARAVGNTPAEFASEMRASMARWAPIMRTLYASANAPG